MTNLRESLQRELDLEHSKHADECRCSDCFHVDAILALFKQYALELVGEDESFGGDLRSDFDVMDRNEMRGKQRQRILEETENNG